jgi:hypothetical protein
MRLGCLVKRSQGGERRLAPLGGHERNKAPKMREPSNANEDNSRNKEQLSAAAITAAAAAVNFVFRQGVRR